jgi:hypothetical protein
MSVEIQELRRFHLTGEKFPVDFPQASEQELRPALLAPYRDLTSLRHDYPLVLIEDDTEGVFSQSLSSIMNAILQEIAIPGPSGERLRRDTLRLETKIRGLISCGEKGSLSEIWEQAISGLLSEVDEAAAGPLEKCLKSARAALRVDGELVGCDEETAFRLVKHAWKAVNQQQARTNLEKIDELLLKLSEILEVDALKSDQAWGPERLEASMGGAAGESFDFSALSHILSPGAHENRLPEARRERIRSAHAVLGSQRFFAATNGAALEEDQPAAYPFVFGSCARARDVFTERIQEMLELIKAIAIAELEIENRYDESQHDSFFAHLDETSLEPEDLAFFPSYLVCLHDKECDGPEQAHLINALSSGLPIKVMVQQDDILGRHSLGDGRFTLGARSLQLTSMAVGLGGVYVLQAATSVLYQSRHRIHEGLAHGGPALFSVCSGSVQNVPHIPPYLIAASAMQSRAFPAFSYNPLGGNGLASRFRIEDNPQAEIDWPVERLVYQDEDLQRSSEEMNFTFVDFAACDRRYANHFALIPRESRCAETVPVSEFLALDDSEAREKIPFIEMIDSKDVLQTLIVDRDLIRAARRCREMWHNLQELGGIHAPKIEEMLEQRPAVEESESAEQVEEFVSDEGTQQAAEEAANEQPPDGAYIDTPRCTTCDECIQINNRIFAYDANRQAYIADPDGGSYRDLVEAAETCQVCIIHPGKPMNPDEPGLEELVTRAESFN